MKRNNHLVLNYLVLVAFGGIVIASAVLNIIKLYGSIGEITSLAMLFKISIVTLFHGIMLIVGFTWIVFMIKGFIDDIEAKKLSQYNRAEYEYAKRGGVRE